MGDPLAVGRRGDSSHFLVDVSYPQHSRVGRSFVDSGGCHKAELEICGSPFKPPFGLPAGSHPQLSQKTAPASILRPLRRDISRLLALN